MHLLAELSSVSRLIIYFAVVGYHRTSRKYWQSYDEPGDVEGIKYKKR